MSQTAEEAPPPNALQSKHVDGVQKIQKDKTADNSLTAKSDIVHDIPPQRYPARFVHLHTSAREGATSQSLILQLQAFH